MHLTRPRSAALPALALAATGLLTACGSDAVTVKPAPSASDPICGVVLQNAPQVLADADRRATNSQSSLAWGDPAITLRCGLEPLEPTTDRCITVTGEGTESVDWVVKENDDVAGEDTERGRFVFTTYGRVPTVEVIVPVEYAGTDATSVLLDLAGAIAPTAIISQCA